MKLEQLVLAMTVAATMSASSRADIISLAPARDTTIIQATNPAAQLANGRGDLFSGRTSQDGQGPATVSIRRSLIYFDIAASLPSWAKITGVSLTMREVMGLNGDPLTTLHRVQQNWGEGTSYQSGGMGSAATQDDATWLYTFFNAAAPATSPTWNSPGGDYDALVSGSTIVSDDNGVGKSFTWTGAGMITDVQSWLNSPAGNFGWLIHGDETRGQSAKRLNGRTLNNSGDVAPVLMVTYVPEPGTALAIVTIAVGVFAAGRSRISHGNRG